MNVSENSSPSISPQPHDSRQTPSRWSEPGRQKVMLMAGSGAVLATSLVVLNRQRLFHPTLRSRILSQKALQSLGRKLVDLSREIGEKAGILERRPWLSRLITGRKTTFNTTAAKHAQERISTAGSEAIDALRSGIQQTRMLTTHLVKNYPASTLGSTLLMLGLLATAVVAPNLLANPNSSQ